MNRACIVAIAVGASRVLVAPAGARACDLPAPTPHVVDPTLQAIDQAPPRLPALLPPSVELGALSSKQASGCETREASCDSVATFDLTALATDNMTAPEKIGYRLSLEAGTLPPGLTLPDDAVESGPGGHLIIAWPGPLPERVADFTLRVVAVDAAGNESAPQLVTYHRMDDIGCGTTTTTTTTADPRPGFALLALLALLLATYRRRRNLHFFEPNSVAR